MPQFFSRLTSPRIHPLKSVSSSITQYFFLTNSHPLFLNLSPQQLNKSNQNHRQFITQLMNSQSQYISHRHLSNNKDYKPRPKHIHKLSDTILQTSFFQPRKTQRDVYKSPHQFKVTKNQYQQFRAFRPSLYEKGEAENKNRYITSNYVPNFEVAEREKERLREREKEGEGMKSPRNYELESSRRLNFKRNSQVEPYLSISMVEGENNNSTINKGYRFGNEVDIKMYKSPRREEAGRNDDILKRIKNYLSPKHSKKQEESFINQNSTTNSKYSVGSTMESNKIKSSQYDSPHFLAKMKAQGFSPKETGFNKKKEIGSPTNRQSREVRDKEKDIKQGLSGPKVSSKFIYSNISFNNNKQEKTIGIKDFHVLNVMGQGHSGVVYKAIHKVTGAIFALKKIPKINIKKNSQQKQLLLEIKYQLFFNHPNIVKLYGCFDDKDNLYLVLEFMEQGTLFQNLQKRLQLLSQKQVISRVKEVCSAVSYIQDIDVLHRDIKPQNIVMSHNVGKLCDFGWVTQCEDRRNTFCGTYAYAAPEILEGRMYDRSVDIWCIGMLTYQLLTGVIAFSKNQNLMNSKRLSKLEMNHHGEDHFELLFPKMVSKKARNFVEIILRKDPRARARIEELLCHPFLIDE